MKIIILFSTVFLPKLPTLTNITNMLFVLWIGFSVLIGLLSTHKSIGFWGAFLLSLILSPIIGLIISLVSSDKEKQYVPMPQRKETYIDEINKLADLKSRQIITEEEFQVKKRELLKSNQ